MEVGDVSGRGQCSHSERKEMCKNKVKGVSNIHSLVVVYFPWQKPCTSEAAKGEKGVVVQVCFVYGCIGQVSSISDRCLIGSLLTTLS